MASNTFEPDTVTVRSHTRRPAKRDTTSLPASFEPAGGESGGSGGGGEFSDYDPQTAFGQTIKGQRATIDALVNIGAGLASMAAPQVSGPAAIARYAGPLGGVVRAIPGSVSRATMAFGGGALTKGAIEPSASPQDVVGAGAGQAGLSLAGEPVAGGVRLLGKGAMALALKANPEIAETAIQEGIVAGRPGVKKLFNLIGALGARTRALVTAAGRGRSLRADQVANAIEAEVKAELGKSSTALSDPNIANALADLKQQFLSNPKLRNGKLSFGDAHTFAQSASAESRPMFVRLENGQRLEMPSDPVRKLWKLTEAKLLRTALEHPAAVGKAYADMNARQSRLIALKNVLAPDANSSTGFGAQALAAARNPIASTVAGFGAGAAIPEGNVPGTRLQHALVGSGLANPLTLSLLGQFLASPISGAMLRQTPRAGAALLGD